MTDSSSKANASSSGDRSLRDVCYERIESNFWYGLFGDFKLIIDRDTGYFNASNLCAQGGKRYKAWSRNKHARKLMDYFEREDVYEIRGCKNTIVWGTYVPADFIVGIASWISVEFYDNINRIVKTYCVNEFVDEYARDETLLKEKLLDLDGRLQKVSSGKEKGLVVKKTPSRHLHTFTIVRKNEPNAKYPYVAVRTQRVNHNNRIRRLAKKHPNLEIVWNLKYHPNAINLYNVIKTNVKNIKVYNTDIALTNGLTEKEFVETIEKLADTDLVSKTESSKNVSVSNEDERQVMAKAFSKLGGSC